MYVYILRIYVQIWIYTYRNLGAVYVLNCTSTGSYVDMFFLHTHIHPGMRPPKSTQAWLFYFYSSTYVHNIYSTCFLCFLFHSLSPSFFSLSSSQFGLSFSIKKVETFFRYKSKLQLFPGVDEFFLDSHSQAIERYLIPFATKRSDSSIAALNSPFHCKTDKIHPFFLLRLWFISDCQKWV